MRRYEISDSKVADGYLLLQQQSQKRCEMKQLFTAGGRHGEAATYMVCVPVIVLNTTM